MKALTEIPELYTFRAIVKRFVIVTAISVGVFFFVLYISNPDLEGVDLTTPFFLNTLGFIILAESLIFLDILFEKHQPVTISNIFNRGIWQFVVSIIISAIIIISLYFLHEPSPDAAEDMRVLTIYFATNLAFLAVFLYSALFRRLLGKWVSLVKQNELLKLEKMEMSYKILQDQLNPHFLFNNLSVLKSMVLLKQENSAMNFIQNFSDIYRYVLQRKDWITVQLSEEVDFIKKYISLHQERLEEGLSFEINVSQEAQSMEIPPMSLQLLVENAVKHNIADAEQVLRIKIYDKEHELIVENNIQLKESSYSTKAGMANLEKRYAHLTERKVEVLNDDETYKVKIPLL